MYDRAGADLAKALMSRIYYREGFKYQLARPYSVDLNTYGLHLGLRHSAESGNSWVSLDTGGILRLAEGYAWDGSTWARDTRKSMRASLIHDALYQLIRLGALPRPARSVADRVYYELMREDGTWWPRAEWRALALEHFGGLAAYGEPRPVLVAP